MLEYSIRAVVKINELCERGSAEFFVVLPGTHNGDVSGPTFYSAAEAMISYELKKNGLKVMVPDDHLDGLSQAEARIAFDDQQPSRLAVTSYVNELVEKLGLAKP